MRSPAKIAAALAAATAVLSSGAAALAAPATIDVRIEGTTTTIFEGPVVADGMYGIQAPSDVAPRDCDGTNNGAHPTAGPTPTTAAITALRSIGQPWDGDWYPGYDDYFITQLGERQDEATNAYWGVLVNGSYTPVGGCQLRVHEGDEVVWVSNAFIGTGHKPYLRLSGPTEVRPGDAATFTVTGDGAPFAGATVGGVPATGADGAITLVFDGPGWQTLKADSPSALRSPRLQVCVRPADGPSCDAIGNGPPPRLWTQPGGGGGGAGAPAPGPDPAPTPAPPAPIPVEPTLAPRPQGRPAVRLRVPEIAEAGTLAVRWSVTDQGAGVRSWVLSARTGGERHFRVLARGPHGKTPKIELEPGRVTELRLIVVDAAGRESEPATATVGVTRAVRSKGVRLRGAWSRAGDGARGRKGATLRTRLDAGRPVVRVRRAARGTRLVLRAGGKRRIVTVGRRARQVAGPPMRRSGTLKIKVRRGAVTVDGVAPTP